MGDPEVQRTPRPSTCTAGGYSLDCLGQGAQWEFLLRVLRRWLCGVGQQCWLHRNLSHLDPRRSDERFSVETTTAASREILRVARPFLCHNRHGKRLLLLTDT